MSLLNNMLKNLDARKKEANADPLSDVIAAKYPKKDRAPRIEKIKTFMRGHTVQSLSHNALFLRSATAVTVFVLVALFFVFREPFYRPKIAALPPKIVRALPVSAPVSSKLKFQHTAEPSTVTVGANDLESLPHQPNKQDKVSNLVIKKTEQPLLPRQLAEQHYAKAMALVGEGHMNEGIKELKALLIHMPEYNLGRNALIVMLLKQGNMAEADRYLLGGLEKSPAYVPFVVLRTQYLIHENKLQDALMELSRVSPDKANRLNYYALSGVLNLRLKHYEAAKNTYKALLDLEPGSHKWWLGFGVASQALGDTNGARDAFGRAQASGGTDLRLQSYLSKQLNDNGDHPIR